MGHHARHAHRIIYKTPRGNWLKRESSSRMATEWFEWKAHEGGIFICHQMNNTEKRIGERKIPVNEFHGPSQTVFQFHGCWWNGHICHLTKGKEMNEKRKDQ